MSGVITPPSSLQTAYNAGQSIVEGSGVTTITNTAVNSPTAVLSINRSPTGLDSGSGILITMGSNTNQTITPSAGLRILNSGTTYGIEVIHTGATSAVTIQQESTAPAIRIDSTAAVGSFQMSDGSSAGLPDAVHGRIRYNTAAAAFQVSCNGAAYTSLGTLAGSTLQVAYDAGNTIALTAARTISLTNAVGQNQAMLTIGQSAVGAGASGINFSVAGALATPNITSAGIIYLVPASVAAAGYDVNLVGGPSSTSTGGNIVVRGGVGNTASTGGSAGLRGGTDGSATAGALFEAQGALTGAPGLAKALGGAAGAGSDANTNAGGVQIDTGNSTGTGTGTVTIKTAPAGGAGTGANASTTKMIVYGNGTQFQSDTGTLPYVITSSNSNDIRSYDTLNVTRWYFANASPGYVLQLGSSRGTTAVPLAVQSGDLIGQIDCPGYIGPISGHSTMGRMAVFCDGAPVDNVSGPGRFEFQTGTAFPLVTQFKITALGNVVKNSTGAVLAQNATDGFIYIPVVNTGAPSGTPTAYTGNSALAVQGTTLYFYNGGAWNALSPSAAGAAGWSYASPTITLTTSTDNVGIGATPAGTQKLIVTGDATHTNVLVTGGRPAGAFTGGTVSLVGGEGGTTSGQGGPVILLGGSGATTGGIGGIGGSVTIDGGSGRTNSNGGTVQLTGGPGDGSGLGGSMILGGGTGGATGAGGITSITGGVGGTAGAGGLVSVTGGAGTGTDKAAGGLTLSTGLSTGTGTSHMRHQTSFTLTTSATTQTAGDRFTISGKTLVLSNTSATLTTFCTLTNATTLTGISGTCFYLVEAFDGTNIDTAAGHFDFVAVNKAGTLTVTAGTITDVKASTSGSITSGITVTATGTTLNLNVTPVFTTLVPTTVRITFSVVTNGFPTTVSPQ